MDITIGTILRLTRERLNYSKQDVCTGICSHTAYARYESDDRVPAKALCDIFFQRLGLDYERIEYVLPDKYFGIRKTDGSDLIEINIALQHEELTCSRNLYFNGEFAKCISISCSAWGKTRSDTIDDSIAREKTNYSNAELELALLYAFSNNHGDYRNRLYAFIQLLNKKRLYSYQRHLINVFELELLKFETNDNNFGIANNLYEKIKDEAVDRFDKSILSQLFSINMNDKNNENLAILFNILELADKDGLINDEGWTLWQNTIKQKL